MSEVFFVAGGTLSAEASSYVERSADAALFSALSSGKFCYVLNSRQMGKSSICVRTMRRLAAEGARTAFVDLTKIGGKNVTPEQWYAGIVMEIGRSLDMRTEILTYWKENSHVSPVQRLFGSLREVVLEKIQGPVAVFFDEIDATRSLSFSADEFFAAIRECNNRRVHDETYKRLTFCLLGVAVPSDLINSPTSTPFNIGERIYLRDFTLSEAMALAAGLGEVRNAEQLLERAFYWTGGHPYLTQSLCSAIAADPSIRTREDVDALVKRDLFEPKARETNINLADVANRALHAGDLEEDPEKFRADLLSAYEKAWKGKPLADDESNRVDALLKLSGIMRSEDNHLKVRNRIYQHVFDRRWIRENMPGQELRRQKRAFYLGVIRTTSLAAIVIGTVSFLAVRNKVLAETMERERNQARYEAYIATMRNMADLRGEHNLTLIHKALDRLRDSPWRGWEWQFWNRLLTRASKVIDPGKYSTGFFFVSPDGKYGLSPNTLGVGIFDVASGRLLRTIDRPIVSCSWLRDSRLFLGFGFDGTLRLCDAEAGTILTERKNAGFDPNFYLSRCCTTAGDREAVMPSTDHRLIRFDIPSLKAVRFGLENGPAVSGAEELSKDGALALWCGGTEHGPGDFVVLGNPMSGKVLAKIPVGQTVHGLALSPDATKVAIGTRLGRLYVFDIKSRRLEYIKLFDGSIMCVQFSPDGKMVLAASRSREAALVDVSKSKPAELQRFEENNDAGFLPNGKEIYTAYWDVRFYGIAQEPEVPTTRLGVGEHEGSITANGDILDWNKETGVRLVAPLVSPGKPRVSPIKGTWGEEGAVILRKVGKHLQAIDNRTNAVLRELPISPVDNATASANRRYAAVGQGTSLFLYDLSNQRSPLRIPLESWPISCCFTDDASVMAVGTSFGRVSLYRTSDCKLLWADARPRNQIVNFAFSPDGSRLAGCGDNDTGEVWDTVTGNRYFELVGHSQSVLDIDWSPDGTRLVTGGEDKTVRLWDASTGAQLGVIGRHDFKVVSVKFLPGGRTIASFSQEGVAKLWMTEARR